MTTIPKDGIERHQAKARRARDQTPEPRRDARECVVDADHNRAARTREPHEAGERSPRIRSVMQHAGRIDHVEGAPPQPRPSQIRLDELHTFDAKPPRRRSPEPQRRAGQIRADDNAIGTL